MKISALGSLLIVVISSLACTAASETMRIARFETPPAIDGKLTEDAWTECEILQLHNIRRGPLKNATIARVGYDDGHLYVAFRCEEAAMDRLVTVWHHAEERDNTIWQDDCVEIFLGPDPLIVPVEAPLEILFTRKPSS